MTETCYYLKKQSLVEYKVDCHQKDLMGLRRETFEVLSSALWLMMVIMLLNYFWLKYWPIQDLWWRARHILGNKFSTLSRVRVLKKLYGSFLWITSPRLQSHYENAAYFNSLSALELLVLIVLTFDWSKVESVMEMYNVVEPPM